MFSEKEKINIIFPGLSPILLLLNLRQLQWLKLMNICQYSRTHQDEVSPMGLSSKSCHIAFLWLFQTLQMTWALGQQLCPSNPCPNCHIFPGSHSPACLFHLRGLLCVPLDFLENLLISRSLTELHLPSPSWCIPWSVRNMTCTFAKWVRRNYLAATPSMVLKLFTYNIC